MKSRLQNSLQYLLASHFQLENQNIEIQQNKSSFQGDYSIVLFPLVKVLKLKPEDLCQKIGELLLENNAYISAFTVVKGFLNVSISDKEFISAFHSFRNSFDTKNSNSKKIMVEYSSPNTNKPLHLGHIRNNLLGFSIAQILDEVGYEVIKTQIINDRGIHICKSMIAWQKFGNETSPASENLKGDKFVGNYYVKFDQEYKIQIKELIEKGISEEEAKKQAPILLEAQEMLLKWEQNDPEIIALWKKMNDWVYAGFNQTYQELGVAFDEVLYESNTYLLGKDIIEKALSEKTLYKKEDGSVWCDLSEFGLDDKLLLRKDGTSVYMTQDLGTAVERFKNHSLEKLIYTVGNEQDYHFQVLFLILKKIGFSWASELHHLSYGMVELPEGKMKSREGTVVDADDLMHEMIQTAQEKSELLGKLEGFTDEQKQENYKVIGLGALKYFMLKIDPKKKMLFNPAESIDFNGNTGPFLQYAYARIQSLLAKAQFESHLEISEIELHPQEKELLVQLFAFKENIQKSAEMLNPAHLANTIYDLVKSFNSFYQNHPIINPEKPNIQQFRLELANSTAKCIKKALHLMGIEVVNRM